MFSVLPMHYVIWIMFAVIATRSSTCMPLNVVCVLSRIVAIPSTNTLIREHITVRACECAIRVMYRDGCVADSRCTDVDV